MKSMKLWMGVAAAVALTSGCGGSVSEDACDRLKASNDDAAERMEACIEPGQDTSFDTEACVADLEQCTEQNAKQTADFLACAVDATNCNSFDSFGDPTDAYFEKLMACEERHNPSSSCMESISMLSDRRTAQAVRKALQVQ